jgi:PAS domain S-box-containing protein
VLLLWGRVQLLHGHTHIAIGTICLGLFGLAIIIVLTEPAALPILMLLPIMVIAVALPYISGRTLRRLIVASWLVGLIIATIAELEQRGNLDALIPGGITQIVGIGIASALNLLLLWQFSSRLDATLAQNEAAITGLQIAHAQLETQHEQLVRDTEERQQAAEALRRSEEQFRLTFEIAPIGMALIAISGQILRVNQALCATTGYTADELLSRTLADITHPDDLAGNLALLEDLLAGKIPFFQLEKRHIGKEGQVIHAILHVVLNRDVQGNPLHFIGQVVDITERKQAEEQRRVIERKLLETQKLESLGVLAGGIAHDFNNLLTGILGNAELALDDLPAHSPAYTSIHQVAAAAQRAAELTRQMLAYAGRGRFIIEQIDLNQLIREMSQLLNASIGKAVRLEYALALNLPWIEADAAQLRQVVINLVTNASEAIGDQPGLIAICTSLVAGDTISLAEGWLGLELGADAYVLLAVSDSGSGMDAETQAKIFEPFFTTKFTGRGLGLAAVQGIVRGHKGGLKVSSALGHGATFEILLPAEKSPNIGLGIPPAGETGSPDGGTVLIVDDEEDVRMVAERMVARAGFSVLLAHDGQEAIEIFAAKADAIACVLLDLTMPNLGGEQVARALRAHRPTVPIVLMSGYNEHQVSARFADLALSGYLQKPFTFSLLQQQLHKALAQAS